jgi:hypothetical protein
MGGVELKLPTSALDWVLVNSDELQTNFILMMMLFWVLAPCRIVGRCESFGETYCLHFQGWKWEQYDSPKRHLPTSLHGAKTQKNIIIIIILTAVKTSNFI